MTRVFSHFLFPRYGEGFSYWSHQSVFYPKLITKNLYLRNPVNKDWKVWKNLRSESKKFLEPWEPVWQVDSLSKLSYRRRVNRYAKDAKEDTGYAFLIFSRKDNVLLGGINISNVVRGARMSCSIGYWIGERHARKGYMFEAATKVIDYIFNDLKLCRIEAGCIPNNHASARLLRSLGFQEEGYAREYLKINGKRHDHILFSLLADDVNN